MGEKIIDAISNVCKASEDLDGITTLKCDIGENRSKVIVVPTNELTKEATSENIESFKKQHRLD